MAWIDVADKMMTDGTLQLRSGKIRTVIATAYLIYTGEHNRYDGEDSWRENIDGDAIARAVAAKPTMRLVVDGGGLPVARTSNGSLELWADNAGLKITAVLLATDPNVSRLRGGEVLDFKFWVTDDEWTMTRSERRIKAFSLHNCDISIDTR